MNETLPAPALEVKSCCATIYSSEWARLLLGDSFHPGGLGLTERLGTLLELSPATRLLDVAAGVGTSAIHLAQRFGCSVVGVDYGGANVAKALEAAREAGVADRVTFVEGDAERLEFTDNSFDAVICECAYCTFPDKRTAASELVRVVRPGGRLGLSDITRSGPLPEELEGLLSWVACIADAMPVEQYSALLRDAGFRIDTVERHNQALGTLIREIKGKLGGAELLVKLKQIEMPGADFGQARRLAGSAAEAVEAGKLGYAIVIGTKPAVGVN